MDIIDKQIIDILQINAKITNVHLANEIGLSPSSTLERVKKIEKSGVIKNYTLNLCKDKIGLQHLFFLYIKLNYVTSDIIKNSIESLQLISNISELYRITGIYHFFAKVFCKSPNDLDEVLEEMYSSIKEIDEIKSEICLKIIKDDGALPVY